MCDAGRDLYAVLGADASDSAQQLRHRYQQLALQCHPDRVAGGGSAAAEKFLEVDAAWKVLRDESSRRRYDLQRRAVELKQDGPVDCTVSLEDMSWDQGECAYSHCCRCGGGFSISQEEVDEEEQRKQSHEEEQRGMLVRCDTCSLSVHVTWASPTETVRSERNLPS
ncbi:dnaJ homolog subfamily C member 24 [Brachionichthys hirsutus]|uniref:dnaJ homolog subfamily C member 24 n=1 Tax=Brachionichthys hirsutus TaxID=412623 RepID=UPI0036052725